MSRKDLSSEQAVRVGLDENLNMFIVMELSARPTRLSIAGRSSIIDPSHEQLRTGRMSQSESVVDRWEPAVCRASEMLKVA
ncbi:hypothetical protein N7539_005140 [Penicillium diatomitis]|uniref:Uncharacterized protein n=1 Tax=Penicillium diatomitis TaxID=2819901 RepID=A0A9W9X6F7_9EURO|nr:uncharacterized protein N7539_005140 [Penicillium diatomitis]KAJ5485152.1 hypothetical protein N7539_005140 [Penicillium diatomitis]